MPPGGARDEQQHAGDHHVDHPRAEVRLGDHEHRRHQRGEHHADGRVALAQAPRTVDDQRRQRDDQQHLAELGGLEGEEREVDRALRAARARGRAPSTARMLSSSARRSPFFSAAGARSRGARARASHAARRPGRSPGGRRSSWVARGRDCGSRALSVTSEQTPRPITARVSSGSSGRRSVRAGACAAAACGCGRLRSGRSSG